METKTGGSDSCSEASCRGKPNYSSSRKLGEGLQACACIPGKQRAGPARNLGKDRTCSDSSRVSGLHVASLEQACSPPLCPSSPTPPLLLSVHSTRLPSSLPAPHTPSPSPPFHSEVLFGYPNPSGWGGRRPRSDSSCVHPVWPQRTPLPQDTAELPTGGGGS